MPRPGFALLKKASLRSICLSSGSSAWCLPRCPRAAVLAHRWPSVGPGDTGRGSLGKRNIKIGGPCPDPRWQRQAPLAFKVGGWGRTQLPPGRDKANFRALCPLQKQCPLWLAPLARTLDAGGPRCCTRGRAKVACTPNSQCQAAHSTSPPTAPPAQQRTPCLFERPQGLPLTPWRITGFQDEETTLSTHSPHPPAPSLQAALPGGLFLPLSQPRPCSSVSLPHKQEVLLYRKGCDYPVTPGASRPGWWRRIEAPRHPSPDFPHIHPAVEAAPASSGLYAGS